MQNNLTSDELLYMMKLRIWDDALDLKQFNSCMRKLDPTLTDAQLKSMANQMKNSSNKVEILVLLQNLCGHELETYDFRNRMFKRIYSEINGPKNEQALIRAFYKRDNKNDGTLSIHEMKSALDEVITTVDEKAIELFIKFLEKDKRGRVNYSEFLN